jgi:hypothetical protein
MTLPTTDQPSAWRSSPVAEPLGAALRYDYADSFEVAIRESDARTAERVVRTGLEHAPAIVGWVVVFTHRHVLRFRLGPASSPKHIVGWQITTNEPDVLCLKAEGSLVDGMMVARRTEDNVARLTTFLSYQRPLARFVWAIVGPVHRRVAPYLMERAASSR